MHADHKRLFLIEKLIDVEIALAWELHRLTLVDGPPEWCDERRRSLQQHIDRHRKNIESLRNQLAALKNQMSLP